MQLVHFSHRHSPYPRAKTQSEFPPGPKRVLVSTSKYDLVILPFIGFLGGIITTWLSVGVGELVAVYLIIRGFNVTMSIANAVILSAFTVWSALPYHAFVSEAVVWQVVLFAGVGAIVGGMIAKYVVLAFSVQRLKLFFGMWVLILGITSLPIL